MTAQPRPPDLVLVEPPPIHVLIAAGRPVERAGLAAMLSANADVAVVAATTDADDALALARELEPGVALVDLGLPGSGLLLVRRLTEAGVGVVAIVAEDGDETLFAALRAGARAMLPKSTGPEALAEAVRAVAAGEALLSPRATRRLIGRFVAQPHVHQPSGGRLAQLTPREREVVALVATGLSNDEIAAQFVISPATVKTHVTRALRKLEARDRSQLVAIAYQCGLARPGVRWQERSPSRPALLPA